MEFHDIWKAVRKAGLKLNIQKTKIMAPSPITSWQIDRKKWKQWQIFPWAPKSLQTVTSATKDKGPYSQSYGFSSSHVRVVP